MDNIIISIWRFLLARDIVYKSDINLFQFSSVLIIKLLLHNYTATEVDRSPLRYHIVSGCMHAQGYTLQIIGRKSACMEINALVDALAGRHLNP